MQVSFFKEIKDNVFDTKPFFLDLIMCAIFVEEFFTKSNPLQKFLIIYVIESGQKTTTGKFINYKLAICQSAIVAK